jgi:quinol monooxygenase YgiN
VDEVVVAGWMEYPGHRDDVLAAARELTKATLTEPGCLGYAFSADADNPDRIQVFERWASPEALTAHLGLPHVLDFRAAIAGFSRSGKSVHQFQVCGVRSM